MIYNETDIIEESLKNLKVENHKYRESYINKLLDYYNGNNVSNYIIHNFDLEAFREVPPYEANITKKFINKMSRIYTVGADRNVNDRYSSLTVLKDSKMKHIERMTRLIGTIATRIMYVDAKCLTLTINLYITFTLSLILIHLDLLL